MEERVAGNHFDDFRKVRTSQSNMLPNRKVAQATESATENTQPILEQSEMEAKVKR